MRTSRPGGKRFGDWWGIFFFSLALLFALYFCTTLSLFRFDGGLSSVLDGRADAKCIGEHDRASYRELLDTAERIVEMDAAMKKVEDNMAVLGRECGVRAVEGRLRGLGKWERNRAGRGRGKI